MEPAELMVRVARVLERLGLRYAVGGSMASMRYGEPRFTNDIDIVVDLTPEKVAEFMDQFPPHEFYVSEEAARQAIRHRSQFNIIHPTSGLKVSSSSRRPTRTARRSWTGRCRQRPSPASASLTRPRKT
jgi:hypothetical protein